MVSRASSVLIAQLLITLLARQKRTEPSCNSPTRMKKRCNMGTTTTLAGVGSWWHILMMMAMTACATAFRPYPRTLSRRPLHGRLRVTAMDRLQELYPNPPELTEYDQFIRSTFPGAITNKELLTRVVACLSGKGFETSNTLVGTSLCSDETARRLQDDFTQIYGSTFNLGGLAGFPFAGNTGFANMMHHVPDDGGSALIVYGPHVGISKTTGEIGVVERARVTQLESCCTSAITACQALQQEQEISGGAMPFNDLQQAAVQQQLRPYMETLLQSDNALLDLPYLLFYSQNDLWNEIVQAGGAKSGGLALLGGIQINTAPDTLDYFMPLRFEFFNGEGRMVEDMLHTIRSP
jgi:hypothetical protein